MNESLKPSILSGLVLAFASLGDAFLYIALPVYALQLHVPVLWIGVLLSINRLVRIVANPLFAFLFHHFGFKQLTILAAFFAMISTLTYGFSSTILAWVIARIVWGFCYSALRISAAGYALKNNRKGMALGLGSGLQELGPVVALLAGPVILGYSNLSTTFCIFSVASAIAILFAFYLPTLKHVSINHSYRVSLIPTSFNLLSFFASFFVQGVLIVSVTTLMKGYQLSAAELVTIAGSYLAYRRICAIILSPLGGLLADRWEINKLYLLCLFFTIVGLLLIATGFIKAGIITSFTFYCVLNALSPAIAALGTNLPIKAVAINHSWIDVGAAAGVLLAGLFMEYCNSAVTFFLATFILLAAGLFYGNIHLFKIKEFVK